MLQEYTKENIELAYFNIIKEKENKKEKKIFFLAC